MSLNLTELLIKHLHSTEYISSYDGTERIKLRKKTTKPTQIFSFYSIYSHLVNAALS